MRWFRSRRRAVDSEMRERIDKIQQRVEQQSFLSEQAVQASQEMTERTAELRDKAIDMRRRNHFGEAVAASMQPRRRRLPWDR
jgi:hypothetical protein